MKRPLRNLAIFLAVILFLIVVLPLVIPLPPLFDTLPPDQLAGDDSRFVQVNGLSVHYKQFGAGEPAIILLHGFGASTFSWREVFAPLSQIGAVIAYDRPAFGLTQRPLPGAWQGDNPYGSAANVNLLLSLMDSQGIQKAVLIGHSAGGAVALEAALRHPDRVQALVLVDAAIYQGGGRRFGLLAPLVDTPQMDRLGPYFARSLAGEQGTQFLQTAWHDPAKITPEITAGYRLPLRVENWDVALWEFTKAARDNPDLAPRLGSLALPVLVLSGDDDRIVPIELSRQLAADIPGAQLAVFPSCGHLPQEECPQAFLDAVTPFITRLNASR